MFSLLLFMFSALPEDAFSQVHNGGLSINKGILNGKTNTTSHRNDRKPQQAAGNNSVQDNYSQMPKWVTDTQDSLRRAELPSNSAVAKQIQSTMVMVRMTSCAKSNRTVSFSISSKEITQAQWESIMGYNPSYHVGPDYPVENVTWSQCQDFIKRLNKLTGKQYRLPTVDEWMFAACGGLQSNGYRYAGSNRPSEVAWYGDNSMGTTHKGGTLKGNELGLYDMSGNVAEWCENAAGLSHAYVGGSFINEASECTVSKSESSLLYIDEASPTIGFRIVSSK